MKFSKFAAGLAFLSLFTAAAWAQQAATETPAGDAPAAPPAPPKTYALISAVGDQLDYVTRKQETGSHLDPFNRVKMKVAGNALNASVLRGLDKVLDDTDPGSKRVYMSLAPIEMNGVRPQDREKVAIGKIVAALEKIPQRKDWDKIIVVTPSFRASEFNGMGTKLQGLGVFVQPLYAGTMNDDSGDIDLDGAGMGDAADTPDGKQTRSKRYVAPYSYTQLWVLDAKTLEVLEKNDRYDNQKYFDPMATAINVANTISTEDLAKRLSSLIEKSASRALSGTTIGTRVDIGDIKRVPSGSTAPAEPPKK